MSASGASRESLTVGVAGVGHLGAYHLKKYAVHPLVGRIMLHDTEPGRAQEKASLISSAHEVVVAATSAECFEQCQAVSVAVPTVRHAEVVAEALAAGCHVLVEKPIASNAREAATMVAWAKEADRVLHVGHVERFNPALQDLASEGVVPGFIEAHRLAPYNPRGTDVPVVLDLMVHDLDLILHLVGEEPTDVQAAGVSVITDSVDIANARLTFPGGCVANVTASRVSLTAMRKLRIFQRDAYLSLDLQQGHRELIRLRQNGGQIEASEVPVLQLDGRTVTRIEFHGDRDALGIEVDAFLRAVVAHAEGSEPEPPHGVGGDEAAGALALAERITRLIARD